MNPATERWTSGDPNDVRLAQGATGLLRTFNRAGILTAADVHVASRTAHIVGEGDETVQLAVALAVRAVRQGSVCVDLGSLGEPGGTSDANDKGESVPLAWPAASAWLDRVEASPLAQRSVVRSDLGFLYLDRYWREEKQVHDDFLARLATPAPQVNEPLLQASAARLFPGDAYAEQRNAALSTAHRLTTVLTGGPGRGKTTTIAGLLALLAEQAEDADGQRLRIALAAPTGKAAARLQEAVAEALAATPQAGRPEFSVHDRRRLAGLRGSTLHRLLGWRNGSSTRFRHDRTNRLPHDLVVVDETSMISLTLMARLLEALRPDTRLVLVGDPDQLASIEAGAVLADLVTGLNGRDVVAALVTDHRSKSTAITRLAAAIQAGNPDAALEALAEGDAAVHLVHPDDTASLTTLQDELTQYALDIRGAALDGDAAGALAAAEQHRLLCAHREGPWGVAHWNRQVERRLGETARLRLGAADGNEWYPGRPVLITANNYGLGLFNGDTGVVVADGEHLRAHINGGPSIGVARLGDVETLHAMTVHKSQGSQAEAVTVLLPDQGSPMLNRELFYTAVTRARQQVRVVGTPESVRAAIIRRAQRATGLATRLDR